MSIIRNYSKTKKQPTDKGLKSYKNKNENDINTETIYIKNTFANRKQKVPNR